MEIEPIARIARGPEGCPEASVVFVPRYRDRNALRGLEGFSHLWLVWGDAELVRGRADAVGNGLALTAVVLGGIERVRGKGSVLHVSGADLPDGAPVFDIKPYVAYTDANDDTL